MALVLNEEQGMLRDSVNAFLSERAPVGHLRKLRDSRDPVGFGAHCSARALLPRL